MTNYDPARFGCTGCGSQSTVVIDPELGRRCAYDMTIPPGGFRDDLAADMVEMGRIDSAWAYLRRWMQSETARRFDAAAVAL